jgi:hypothetical protein
MSLSVSLCVGYNLKLKSKLKRVSNVFIPVFFQAAFHRPIAFTLPHQQLGTVEPVSAQLPIRFKSTLEIDDNLKRVSES